MQLFIPKEKISNHELFLRRASYGRIFDRRSGQISYARRLRGSLYPRLHLYVDDKGDKIVFNLHLDQRQTRYKGASAHAGEYDGPIVEGEINRLKQLLKL